MPQYKAPVNDMNFVLNEVFKVEDIAKLEGYEEATPDMVEAIIGEGARICEDVLFPLNQSGDQEGCHFDNGVVTTPKGFKEAYNTYIQNGWTSLAAHPEYGGQGLPQIIQVVMEEMICSANMSFGMYPGLSQGAYNAIYQHGSEALKNTYLPKLAEGVWSGTMCLTEPHCGTDLGLIKTKANPNDDGSYNITGTKIFISAGEHDLTENILHLVLAKLPGAPDTTKGISLFLVPKFNVKDDGTVGDRNGVACGSIEHKMGIHANATCVINLDDAIGFLVGKPNEGMKAMFTMMNMARLAVGMQGLGLAEVAYQNALVYAKERVQGRSLDGTKAPEKPADPIIVHPGVRLELMTMKSIIEAGRALTYFTGMQEDIAHKHPDADVRQEAEDWVALLTPVIKAHLTDRGFEICAKALETYGGHGFIQEWGMEQYLRDVEITKIYEGTNGIQALDLVGRKMGQNMGRLLRSFFHPVLEFIEENKDHAEIGQYMEMFGKSVAKLQQASVTLATKGLKNPLEAGAGAKDYMKMFGVISLAYMQLMMAKTAHEKLEAGEGDKSFYDAKLKTAKFYMDRILPEHYSAYHALLTGADNLMALNENQF